MRTGLKRWTAKRIDAEVRRVDDNVDRMVGAQVRRAAHPKSTYCIEAQPNCFDHSVDLLIGVITVKQFSPAAARALARQLEDAADEAEFYIDGDFEDVIEASYESEPGDE